MYSYGCDTDFYQLTNYENLCHYRHGTYYQHQPYIVEKTNDDDKILRKFHHQTLVTLETGEKKSIQTLTSNDFLTSANLSQQYSYVLARVDYIGSMDKLTGKIELRFHINGFEKPISYYISQETPFFVHQYSCWSSISPHLTVRRCGLKCRPLECGNVIVAVIEKQTLPIKRSLMPDYSQQSPTKCLVERYMNEKISISSTETFESQKKKFKITHR